MDGCRTTLASAHTCAGAKKRERATATLPSACHAEFPIRKRVRMHLKPWRKVSGLVGAQPKCSHEACAQKGPTPG